MNLFTEGIKMQEAVTNLKILIKPWLLVGIENQIIIMWHL